MFTKCYICQDEIGAERIEGLDVLGVPKELRTCLKCAPNSPIRGIYLGESGNSELVFVSKIDDTRVVREDINKYLKEKEQ
jgi:hypothetical protein